MHIGLRTRAKNDRYNVIVPIYSLIQHANIQKLQSAIKITRRWKRNKVLYIKRIKRERPTKIRGAANLVIFNCHLLLISPPPKMTVPVITRDCLLIPSEGFTMLPLSENPPNMLVTLLWIIHPAGTIREEPPKR